MLSAKTSNTIVPSGRSECEKDDPLRITRRLAGVEGLWGRDPCGRPRTLPVLHRLVFPQRRDLPLAPGKPQGSPPPRATLHSVQAPYEYAEQTLSPQSFSDVLLMPNVMQLTLK